MVAKTTDRDIIEGAAWPHEGEGSRETEGKGSAAKEDGMGLPLEEELMGSTGGEQGEDVRDCNLQEDDIDYLPVLQPVNAPALEEAVGVPRVKAEVQEDEGGETCNGSKGDGHNEDDGDDPAFRVLGGNSVVVSDGDEGAVVDEGDNHQEDHREGEESWPL